MGISVTSKKGQLFITYTKSNQRKTFRVIPLVKVEKEHLDTKAQVIATGNKKTDRELNTILRSNLNWFEETIERLERFEKTQATVTLIARLHREEFLTEIKPVPKDFSTAFQAYLEHKRDFEGLSGKSYLQYSQNFYKRLTIFLTRFKYTNLEEFDETFLYRFKKHLLDLDYSNATYTQTADIFKNFCKYLLANRLIQAEVFFQAKEILKSKTCNNLKDFALSIEEIKEFYEFKKLTKRQTFYRDIFVFNCVTGGMRQSDLRKIKLGDVDLERKVLQVYTQKNKSYITIPLLPLAEDIIRKYNPDIETTSDKDRILFDMGSSLNSINHRFKHVAKKFYRVGADKVKVYPYREFRQVIVENANKTHKTEYKPVFKLFKSSMCRRIFITALLEQNYTFEQIRQFTGHRSYKAFSAYAKLNEKNKVKNLHQAFSIFSVEESVNISQAS